MKFWVGLAIGAALGAAAMYLGLRPPWRGAPSAPAPIAEAPPPPDAGVAPAKKKKGRRTTTTRGAGGADVTREVDDEIALTDADRRLEWRGDPVSQPPRTMDLGADDDARALDDGEIAAGINGGSRAMIACITEAAGGAPLSGEITVQMLVGGDGKAGKVRVRAPVYLHEHGLTACAKRAARGFPFPATGAPTVVTAPFYLN